MDVRIINPGRGYISYHDFVDLGNDSNGNLNDANLDAWLNEGNYTYLQFPIITVSGGGGNEATHKPILDENGSVVDVNITNGGRGYLTSIVLIVLKQYTLLHLMLMKKMQPCPFA